MMKIYNFSPVFTISVLVLLMTSCVTTTGSLQKKSVKELENVWISSSSNTRDAVVKELENRMAEDTLIILLSLANPMYGNYSEEDSVAIIRSLGVIGSDKAIEATSNHVYWDSKEIKIALLYTYKKIGNRNATELVVVFLKDPDQSIRWKALDVIDHLKPYDNIDPVIPLLFDEDSNIRWKAINTLENIGNPKAAMPVSLLLGDIDGTVRSKAAKALKEFGLKTEDLRNLKAKAEQMGKRRVSLESLYTTTLSYQKTLNNKNALEEKLKSQNNENNPKLSKDQLTNKNTNNLDEGKQTSQNSIIERIDLIPNLGDYYALIIGNNDYMNLPKLQTAINDAEKIDSILKNNYGFKTRVLINANRSEILYALSKYRKSLTKKDNLLIYYAGHGLLDKQADEGYWLPIDAKIENDVDWLPNSSITTKLRAIDAKHILIISDSCYSGKLSRDIHIVQRNPNYLLRISQKKARSVLSSGGLEPVMDGGGKGNHSVFASALINALQRNESIMDGTQLFSKIRRSVMLNSDQTPEYSDIRKAGHDGGDFLFLKLK